MLPAQDANVQGIQALRDYYTRAVERDAAAAAQSARSGRQLLAGFCLAGVLLALLASWTIARSITRPIDEAVRATRRIADGDLSVKLSTTGADEMAELLRAQAAMTEGLRRLVGEVAQGARTVAETSAQIAQGNTDLSQRTEEQASTLEETASSMEELTTTVGQNAQNARQASQLAADASRVAGEGGDVVGQVVATMTGISGSSRKIAEIIGVIDGIAFQTNILALNAAVEAARAGDQGRGFAVVATEVRNLAQRSASAAKEIKALISESVQQVVAGTEQVDMAGRKMGDIVQAARKVSELIAEIATASQEQSSGIEQVNTAVMAMDQGVQQNASLVEQATAATESMKAQAAALLETVSRFRLDDTEQPPVQAWSPQAPQAVLPPAIRVREQPKLGVAGAALLTRPPKSAPPAGEWRTF
jgi:methyl-accepting chemotaxis protein